MLKEAQIPFFLWLPAAMLFHFMTGGASVQAAKVLSERADILAFSRAVRSDVRESLLMTVEFAPGQGVEDLEEEEPKPTDDPSGEPDPDAEEETPQIEKIKPPLPQAQKPLKTAPPKLPQPKPPEPEKEKKVAVAPPPAPEPKEEKKPEPKPEPEKKQAKKEEKKDEPQRIELPKPDGRIAVMNDPSIAKDQEDNPNANRIADHANRVQEEAMARFRSYDQNTSKPTGGGQPAPSPIKDPGNALDDQRGFSHQVEGSGDPKPGSESGPDDPPKEPIARSQQGTSDPVVGQEGIKGVKGIEGRAEQKGPSPSDTVSSGDGDWKISADADDGAKAQKGRKGRKAIAGRAAIPGVPMPGALPQQYSINAFGLVDALGKQHLRAEQEKARNTRLSRHRGSFKANEFQKYRAAIENYDPSVKPGNQTSLNAARVPFASYINMMHNRIHPIFADSFLGSLGKLDADDKLNNMKLATHMELVLDGETGAVVRAGIVRGSGVTAFDVAALSSAKSAGPFGKAPDMIVSPDGKVYVHWEFYRDPYFACTSKFARPYLIKSAPKGDDPSTPPGPRPSDGGKENRTAEGQGPLRPTKKQ